MSNLYDWRAAPEWAHWCATDENGEAYWYEFSPSRKSNYWLRVAGRSATAPGMDADTDVPWFESREARPEATE